MRVNMLGVKPGRGVSLPSVIIASLCLIYPLCSGTARADDDLEGVLSGFDDVLQVTDPVEVDITDDMSGILDGFDETQKTEMDKTGASSITLPPWFDPFGSISLMGAWNFAHDAPSAGDADFDYRVQQR